MRLTMLVRVIAAAAFAPAVSLAAPGTAAACGRTPREAVSRYYHAVDARRFSKAWSCLRTASRNAFGGYAHWRAGYRHTRYTRLVSTSTTDQGAGLGHVRFTVDTCRVAGSNAILERVSGTWFAEDGPSGWRIGSPEARIVRRRSASSC